MVFDSPCKTLKEITEIMRLGVNFNINSVKELEKVQQVWQDLDDGADASGLAGYKAGTSCIGLRVNPLVGAGNIYEPDNIYIY